MTKLTSIPAIMSGYPLWNKWMARKIAPTKGTRDSKWGEVEAQRDVERDYPPWWPPRWSHANVVGWKALLKLARDYGAIKYGGYRGRRAETYVVRYIIGRWGDDE